MRRPKGVCYSYPSSWSRPGHQCNLPADCLWSFDTKTADFETRSTGSRFWYQWSASDGPFSSSSCSSSSMARGRSSRTGSRWRPRRGQRPSTEWRSLRPKPYQVVRSLHHIGIFRLPPCSLFYRSLSHRGLTSGTLSSWLTSCLTFRQKLS